MNLISFILGLVFGSNISLFLYAIINIAKQSDDKIEMMSSNKVRKEV